MAIEPSIWPTVPWIKLAFKRARKLATGVEQLTDVQPKRVPRADMDAALLLVQEQEAEIKQLGTNVAELAAKPGFRLGQMADFGYREAETGSANLRRLIESRLARDTGADVEPIGIHVWVQNDNRVAAGDEVLMLLSGELFWGDWSLSVAHAEFADNIATVTDFIISMLPVIGPIYDFSTGMIGYRFDGQKLSNLDRALRVGFSGAGVMLSVIIKTGRVSVKIVMLARAGRALTLPAAERRGLIALGVALAKMSPEHRAFLLAAINAVKTGGKVTGEQRAVITRLLKRTNEVVTASDWAKLAEAPANLNKPIGRAKVMKRAVPDKIETEAIEALEKNLPKSDILVLPRQSPQDFVAQVGTKLRQTPNVKHPELIVDAVIGDIVAPQTGAMDAVLNAAAAKAAQGSMVVIHTGRTTLSATQVTLNAPRLWGKHSCMGLERIIVLDGKGHFVNLARPSHFRLIDSTAMIPVQSLANLRELWNEMEKEEAKEPAGAGAN